MWQTNEHINKLKNTGQASKFRIKKNRLTNMVLNTDNKVLSKLKRVREERKVSVGIRVAKGSRTGC